MKSLVKEALSNAPPREIPVSPGGTAYATDNKVNAELEELLRSLKTNIRIVGCGGGGCNTINRLSEEGIAGAELMAGNTDAQHLLTLNIPHKILFGKRTTRGLGAGAVPKIGEEAAREAEEQIQKKLTGSDIVFITCGLGGGTGTGSAPYVARVAKELGALTIVFVTTPFRGEGRMRMENAMWGLKKLRDTADTVVVIPNDKLLEIVPNIPLSAAFRVADELLMKSIKGLTEIITKPGLVNLDFNDLRTIMKGSGVAMMGIGESDARKGDERATEAVQEALNSPLIEADISTSTGVLINVTGGQDMSVREAQLVAEEVQKMVSPNARIIWGTTVDPTLDKTIRVMIVLTGVSSKQLTGRAHTAVAVKDSGLEMIS